MSKRKFDSAIKHAIKSKLADDTEKYLTDQSSYMLTTTELYYNNNIKLILSDHIKDKVIDIGILDYDVSKPKEKQWDKQQQKFIKKLKYDLYKFELSQLTEKFYVLGQKDNNIVASFIIRSFIQNDEHLIRIIPLIDYDCAFNFFITLNKNKVFDDIDINILSKKKCGVLITNEGISVSHFIEVIKLRINNVNNSTNIDESIKDILEESSNSYRSIHQEIIGKYKAECQNSEMEYDYSSIEDEVLDVVDAIKNAIESKEIICEVVEQLVTKVVKKSEQEGKKLSWDISVVDNDGRTCNNKEVKSNDDEAIEIFAEAVKEWDLKLFKEAKDKSKDFVKLVDYFNKEISYQFWGHFFDNCYYKYYLNDPKLSHHKKKEIEKEYNINVFQGLDGYVFLIKNVPGLLDQLRAKQCSIIKDLPEDRQKNRSKDLMELIESKISVVDSSGDANDQVITNVLMGMISVTNGDLQGIKQDNTEQDKLDREASKNTSSIINVEDNIMCAENAVQENIKLSLIGNIE
ncbi:hypothetical protein [Candidatus Rickettsia colombianensi]|uniref:hypothetical protein n=1 Tax=Candidatus Rickettsia colombianensi TaxID=1090944 RepID=UPI000EF1C68C|nr:hypothetical protein [Candidatus Rickettsia colombianensi]